MALLQDIQVPLLAVNDTTLTVVEMAFASGQQVKKGELIMVFETSKTTYEVESPSDGYIQYFCEIDREYEVNEVVAKIFSDVTEATASPVASSVRSAPAISSLPVSTGSAAAQRTMLVGRPVSAGAPLSFWEGETVYSREAIRLIGSAGIDKGLFAGRDFVTGADVLAMLAPPAAKTSVRDSVKKVARSLPVDPAKVTLAKLSSGKKREIEYLADIQSEGLTSTLHSFVGTAGIFTHINPSLKYLKDSLLPVIIYEASRLLTRYPLLNGYFTGDSVALYKEVNAGFAIDVDRGLKVLKIVQSDKKTIAQIEEEILRLSGHYLDEDLRVEDLTDITFTITDLSSEGIAFFRPLINKMNSSILGISAIDPSEQRCALSLTFDHRVTEGKLAARFLQELKERMESYRPAVDPALQQIACFKCFKTLKEDLGGTGFARCITPEGKEGYICQSCLKGF